MTGELTADQIRSLLKLAPHTTCSFVRLTFLSKQSITAGRLAGAVRGRAAFGLFGDESQTARAAAMVFA
jgi:hypothetical protein